MHYFAIVLFWCGLSTVGALIMGGFTRLYQPGGFQAYLTTILKTVVVIAVAWIYFKGNIYIWEHYPTIEGEDILIKILVVCVSIFAFGLGLSVLSNSGKWKLPIYVFGPKHDTQACIGNAILFPGAVLIYLLGKKEGK